MYRQNKRKIAKLLFVASLGAGSTALAQPAETADAAWRRGHTLLKSGRIHEACQAFEASDRIEANTVTKIDLATCYEQDGKLMSASRLYRHLAGEDPKRAKGFADKADKLEAKAPKLRFAINPRPDGLKIQVDGVDVPTTGDVRVDIGPHKVVATAPGYEGQASAAIDRPGRTVDVILRMQPKAEPIAAPKPPAAQEPAPAPATSPTPLPAAPAPAAPLPAAPPPLVTNAEAAPSHGDHRRRNGYLIGAAGLGLAAGSAVLLGLAASKFSDERDLCPNATCANATDLARADALLSNGKTMRGVGIGLGIGGVALLAVGTYLLLTPSEHADRVSIQVTSGGGAIGYSGKF